MKLGIISDAQHYYTANGQLCALEIVARQFEQWAALFDEVIVCAPLMMGQPPGTHSPYRAANIRLLPITNAGGNSLRAKLGLAWQMNGWWRSLQSLFRQVDAVHIRCPNNISILGLLALQRTSLFRQAVYTGAWGAQIHMSESITYRWQRWFLKNVFRGPVAVYGKLPGDPDHIVSSFSPSFTLADWEQEDKVVSEKTKSILNAEILGQPLQIISVGMLDRRKNQQLLIHALKILREKGVDFHCSIYGDGELRSYLQNLIEQLNLQQKVKLCGKVSHAQIREAYRTSYFVVQTPLLEGYGKVPNEAFFYGCIPLLSNINLSEQIVGGTERGRCFSLDDPNELVLHLLELRASPNEMVRLIQNGRRHAKTITLEAWRDHIRRMCESSWGVHLS